MDFIRYTFNEDEWNIYLIEDDDNDIADDDAGAQTKFLEKELYFRKEDLSESIVRHELWHVYLGYCYLSDVSELSVVQMNEITASLFEDKGEKILIKAKDIYEKLKKLKQE